MHALSDSLAKNVATKLNVFLKDTLNAGIYSQCTIKVEFVDNGFIVAVNGLSQPFSLTSDEMGKIVNTTNNTVIYDVIKGPLEKIILQVHLLIML